MLKLGLLLVMLHALHEAHSYRQVHKGWDIMTPHRVRATRGSCVVIPCTYDFPETTKTINTYHGAWKIAKWDDVATSRAYYPRHPDYDGRTRFLGYVRRKNCTWSLSRIRDSDARLYYFRIEMLEYESYSWLSQKTELQVVDAKQPDLKVSEGGAGRDVLAYCSVTHSCPRDPPTLTWNRGGTELRGTIRASDWQWIIYSVLQIPPQDSTVKLICSITYYGGQTLSSTVTY